jgi:hypothetical protein
VATLLNETGLRPEEAHRLEWNDIDRAERGGLLVRRGKTAAARRRLPLTPNVRAMLGLRWQAAGQPETGFVFPAATQSGHIEHWTLKKQHRNALKKSGLRSFLLYSLRHTFATRIAPCVDPWTLCKIMGWASLSVAMVYIHAQEDRVLSAFSQNSATGGHEFGHVANKGLAIVSAGHPQIGEGLEGYLVSAAGFEPATHALKGQVTIQRPCVFNRFYMADAVKNRAFGVYCCPSCCPSFGWNTISCCMSVVAKMDTAFDMKKVAEKFLAATRHTSGSVISLMHDAGRGRSEIPLSFSRTSAQGRSRQAVANLKYLRVRRYEYSESLLADGGPQLACG